MPPLNIRIAPNARISVAAHFLKSTKVPELVRGRYATNAPGKRYFGVVISESINANGKKMCVLHLDELPGVSVSVLATSLKYEGPRTAPVAVREPVAVSRIIEEEEESSEEEEQQVEREEEEEVAGPSSSRDCWTMGPVGMDTRLTSANGYKHRSKFLLPNCRTASPADYFLFFLPMDFINNVVIPNINAYAMTIVDNWVEITFLEYITWMALLTNMTVLNHIDKRAYWHMGSSHLFPIVNFSEYMSFDRFNLINQWHIFEIPDGVAEITDTLYQIRRFLAEFNTTLSKALEPGKYLCVDESMNQWLGKGMPNLKKVPRKPHPIGQEYKTLADHDTYLM